MADIQEAIRRLTVQATSTGVDETTAKLNKLSDAQDGVAKVSDSTSKASLSLEQAYNRQSLRLDDAARMQSKYSQEAKIAQGALSQGVITAADYAARMDLIGQKYGTASTLSRAFSQATSGVSAQITALAAGAGPVGVFLSALGPWGIAAAAGLGLVGAAIHYVAEESTRMGQKAIELQRFKEITELTVAQIGALRSAGAEFGLQGDQIAMSFERMTGQLQDARRATGSLYDDVRLVSGSLAEQLRQTSSTAEAINVLARAYQQAGDAATKAQIARAAFGGRGGAALGPVLGQIADAGGIQNLATSMGRLNEATDAQTKQWAQMQAQIDETNKRAKNILASIFTDDGLRAQLAAAQTMERIARAAKDIADQQSGLTAAQRFMVDATRTGGVDTSGVGVALPAGPGASAQAAMMAARFRLTNQMGAGGVGVSPADVKSWGDLVDKFHAVAPVADTAAQSLKQVQDAAAADAKIARDRIGLLGQAATFDEQRRAKLIELRSALLDNKLTQEDYNRAVAAENAAVSLQVLQARIGLLGNLASVDQQVLAMRMRINTENARGLGITKDQTDAILRETQVRAEAAKLQTQAQFGIFDATRQSANAQLELQTLIDSKAIKTSNDYAAALTVVAKRLRDTADQAAVARSNLPQLTQLMLDAGNGWKQLDTAATSSLNSLNNSLLDFETGAKSGSQAMKDFELAFIRSLLNMMNQMLIIQPIAIALKSALGFSGPGAGGGAGGGIGSFFSSIFGGGGGSVPTTAGTIDPTMLAAIAHTGGIVGSGSLAGRYVHPTYFDGADRFAMGGLAGLGPDEVPIIAHRNEEIVRADDPRHRANGGGAPVIQQTNHFYGADPGSEARLRGAMIQAKNMAVAETLQRVPKVRSNNPGYLSGSGR